MHHNRDCALQLYVVTRSRILRQVLRRILLGRLSPAFGTFFLRLGLDPVNLAVGPDGLTVDPWFPLNGLGDLSPCIYRP